MQNAIVLPALASLAVILQGCTFGSQSENCSGDACACALTFHSFWARIRVSGVQIEHASATYQIPDVDENIENASVGPCCNAIYDQIDYDQGKGPSMPNRPVDSFTSSCAKSPNKNVSAAAAQRVPSRPSGLSREVWGQPDERDVTAAVRRLRPLASETQTNGNNLSWEPVDDGQVGQDCFFDASKGFELNGVPIVSASMKLRIRWVDPEDATTQCCNALQPVLSHAYIDGRTEADLPKEIKDRFCEYCKKSNNHDIALAAYRCFGTEASAPVVA